MAFYDNGLRFECQRCSACCRFEPGIVRIHDEDEKALMEFLKLEKKEFEERYCRPGFARDGGPELWLKEKPNYDCIFWDAEACEGGGCIVYPVRPKQCVTWPFWAYNISSRAAWQDAARDCPGIDKGRLWTKEEIEQRAGLN
jgi:Fe-S-cluster containining protein